MATLSIVKNARSRPAVRLQSILMMASTISAVLFMIGTEDIRWHMAILWGLAFLSGALCKYDLLHPYCWFPFSFALYSSAYGIMHLIEPWNMIGYHRDNLLLPLVAMSVFLLSVGSKTVPAKWPSISEGSQDQQERLSLRLLLVLLLGAILIATIYLATTNFSHKNEMISSRNPAFLLGAYSARFLAFLIIPYLVLLRNKASRGLWAIAFGFSGVVLMFSLFSGERDAIFRIVLIVALTMFALKRIRLTQIPILLPLGISGMMLLSYFKYYFVNGFIATSYSLSSSNVLYRFLNVDFAAAGMNLQVLINHPWTRASQGYWLLLSDALSPLFPGATFFNAGQWFNDTFYSNSYSRAFTLVGQGYVIDGYLGVIILFSLLGLIVRFAYHYSSRGLWWFSAYVYLIPTTIMAFRSSFSTVFTGIIRIACVAFIVAFVCKRALVTAKHRKRTR